ALATGADRVLDPEGREWAWVAGPAAAPRKTGHVLGSLRDHAHLPAGGAYVLGRYVAAADRVHGLREVEQCGVPALGGEADVGIGHDHALAATQRQVGDGGLVGHRPRQTQNVAERGSGVVV